MNSSKNPLGVIPLTEQPLNHQVTTQKTKAASDVEEKPQDGPKAQADCHLHQVQEPDTPPRAGACCCHIAKRPLRHRQKSSEILGRNPLPTQRSC